MAEFHARGMLCGAVALLAAACPGLAWSQNETKSVAESGDKPVANLPFARGKSFATLDQYLAHLKKNGEIDLPWWREIRPGFYEYVTTMTGRPRQTATRAELLKRYGFQR